MTERTEELAHEHAVKMFCNRCMRRSICDDYCRTYNEAFEEKVIELEEEEDD